MTMLRYECDSCHALKKAREEWILGLAAENIGAVSARREIAFEPEWDLDRATHPLAVHFCSMECKDKYLRSLFGNNVARRDRDVVPIPKDTSTRSACAHQRTRKRAS
jgi:hypothetical protein